MLNNTMLNLGRKSSVIREIFEYGKKRKSEIGESNVFDFSLGNPSIPVPSDVTEKMLDIIKNTDSVKLHGYTSAPGDFNVRQKIADSIVQRFGFEAKPQNIYMTCGAAASLTVCLNAVVNQGDEVIVFSPFFPEYRVFAENAGAKVVAVKCREDDFQIDFSALEKSINKNTKAVIVNSPNNPTGVVLSENTIKALAELLNKKSKEFGNDIYIIADEPYRELSYDVNVPYIPKFYKSTAVCYSFSKSLSLPGERIGYIFVSPKLKNCDDFFAAVCGAGRALGFVCAPSLMQYTVAECLNITSDINVYRKNRDILYTALTEYGYNAVKPDGAFYLFVKSPEADAVAFCERAKNHELLLVPSNDFGISGYVRISYCVSEKQIRKSLPAFKELISEYR